MSDNEDLLGDDLGDQSLADYNLGNEEEEQLLADDYESAPQNVPSSIRDGYSEPEMLPSDYPSHAIQYAPPPMQYQPIETEGVVPNITIEVPNVPPHAAYVPVDQRHYEAEHAVPPAIPAGPIEPPQIVPSEVTVPVPNEGPRERFVSERPTISAVRMPRVRDIPDSLDKVVIPGGGRTWRAPHYPRPRAPHPYRRHHQRGNFNQRNSFPPQHIVRPNIPPQIIRQEIRPEIRPQMIRPDIRPDMILPVRPEIRPNRPEMIRLERPEMIRRERPELIQQAVRPDGPPEIIRPDNRPEIRPDMIPDIRPDILPQMGPEISPERPILPDMFRPPGERPFFPRFQFRPEERPVFRPNFERPMYPFPRQQFNPRFGPPMREIVANSLHMPQVTIRQDGEAGAGAGLPGKKVLINPHFKGNYHPVDGLPAYIPTRILKSPPRSPPHALGPVKDIDDAAERFIAEQRTALARAAGRKRRSPQRYIENTTIEIENELARARRLDARHEDDLLRRQEEFISANRAGLRRRMRSPSPSPPRAPPSPPSPPRRHDEQESEYKRRLREQESLRERVLRAKEVRRRKNAVALHKQLQDKERETQDKTPPQPAREVPPKPAAPEPARRPTPEPVLEETKPDTTRNTPEKSPEKPDKGPEKRERSPHKDDEVNSTCEGAEAGAEGSLTPAWRRGSDDDLDMILGDIDGILSSDEDSGRFKDKPDKVETVKSKPVTDLRSKLPPKATERPPRQKIVFEEKDKKKRGEAAERAAARRALLSRAQHDERKLLKSKPKAEPRSRQKITFDNREKQRRPQRAPGGAGEDAPSAAAGIFSRAVRTITDYKFKKDEPQIEYESDSEIDEDKLLNEEIGNVAHVDNLPHGMTDTRLRTLAGNDVQSLVLDKEERSAKITFRGARAATSFQKKFHGKMVAASRLAVSLR